MDTGLLLVVVAGVILCGVVYLIGHAHGKATTSPVIVIGGGAGAGASAPDGSTPDVNNSQIKSE
jgi:hypothetical protein